MNLKTYEIFLSMKILRKIFDLFRLRNIFGKSSYFVKKLRFSIFHFEYFDFHHPDIAQITFTLPVHKIYKNLRNVAAVTALYHKLKPHSALTFVTQELISRFDFLQIDLDQDIYHPPESPIHRYFSRMIKSFPNARRKRDIAQIQNPISEDRTREILHPDPEPTRFVIKLNPALTLLDFPMIEDTNIALMTLKTKYNQINSHSGRNATAMKLIDEFLQKLEDANYFKRMPILLHAIQAIAKGTLMHNFVNATSLNLAITKLSNQVSDHTGKTLSVKKLADLFTLPASFLKRNQQYHILLNIPISHTINVHTYQLDKILYLFIRNNQPY